MTKNVMYFKSEEMSNLDEKFSYVTQNVDLECCICSCIYISPLEHVNCHNSFCEDCIIKCTHCPLCREEIDEVDLVPITTKFILNLLDKCIVKCNRCNIEIERSLFIHHFNNVCLYDCRMQCGEKVTLGSQVDHFKTCLNYQIRCQDCGTVTTRKMKDNHEIHCPEKRIPCEFCKGSILRKNYKNHILTNCRRYPLTCECLKKFERQYFAKHCTTCPEVIILCKGSEIGCNFKPKRKESINHENECVYAKISPDILNLKTEQLKMELEKTFFE